MTQNCEDLLGHFPRRLGDRELAWTEDGRTDGRGHGLGNKLRTENDSGVMLVVTLRLEDVEESRRGIWRGDRHLK